MKDRDTKGYIRIPRNSIEDIFGFTPRIDEELLYNPKNIKEPFYFNAEDHFNTSELGSIPFANKQQIDEAKAVVKGVLKK